MSDRRQALLDAEQAITARLAGYDPRKDRTAIAATIMAALVVRRLRTGETQTEINPGFVVVPEELPAPKWLDRVAEEISEYRGLQAGWDGENAETPSAHSVNEAVEFIRSLERGDIEPALHADGTVIILIGHTTLRFTNEGMSFVTRAAPSPGIDHSPPRAFPVKLGHPKP